MKEYTAEDCVKDEYNDDGSRSLYFECEDDPKYLHEVKIWGITLNLTEEIEKQGGGPVAEFAASVLNDNNERIQEEKDVRDFLEEISDEI